MTKLETLSIGRAVSDARISYLIGLGFKIYQIADILEMPSDVVKLACKHLNIAEKKEPGVFQPGLVCEDLYFETFKAFKNCNFEDYKIKGAMSRLFSESKKEELSSKILYYSSVNRYYTTCTGGK